MKFTNLIVSEHNASLRRKMNTNKKINACGVIINVTCLFHSVGCTPCLKKLCQCYFENNSVKRWPNLIIFGTQHREDT